VGRTRESCSRVNVDIGWIGLVGSICQKAKDENVQMS
jgi:hypothetical protein